MISYFFIYLWTITNYFVFRNTQRGLMNLIEVRYIGPYRSLDDFVHLHQLTPRTSACNFCVMILTISRQIMLRSPRERAYTRRKVKLRKLVSSCSPEYISIKRMVTRSCPSVSPISS